MLVPGTGSRARRAAVASWIALALSGALLAAPAVADPSPEAAVAELSSWRGEVGESPVASPAVAAWSTGCEHHDSYEHLNGGALTHGEAAGNPGYTADGEEAGANSVLAAFFSSPAPTPDASLLPGPTWDAAIFHRAALLQPRLARTGFDSTTFADGGDLYRTFTCMRTQGGTAIDDGRTTPALSLYPSPANGSYGVPTKFPAGSESPDPAGETGVPAGATLGWPLNVEINGPWSSAGFGYFVNAHDVTATLAPDGTSDFVPLVVSQCGANGCGEPGGTADGVYFGGGFGIFPTQALAADTTYRVVLTGGTVTDRDAHVDYPIPAGYSWCFSTGSTYVPSGDCAPATTAAQEPVDPGASTVVSGTTSGGGTSSSGGSTSATGGTGSASAGSAGGGTGTSTTSSSPPAAHCVVPKLGGSKLPAVRKRIAAAGCRLGKVSRHRGPRAAKGRASHQSVRPGTVLPAGARIDVVIDRG